MTISGQNLIAGEWSGKTEGGFKAFNAQTHKAIDIEFADATELEVNTAIERANDAFTSYSQLSATKRAAFLRAIGAEILALGDELVDTACAETGLPAMRIQGERGRTIGQLALFADLLEAGEYQCVIEQANNDRQPLPKPDTRLGYLPLGVVGVFAASNFPLAFSTAGGDTASALAAGCPVVMKAHAAHPATAELVARAILKAIESCDLDRGIFSLIQGKNYAIATQIVSHPLVKAVGFTGSERVGMILQAQIHQRPEPIPFYGELGSINPQFIMPNKVAQDGAEIAQGLVASLMMGQGQFCTSPGVWVVVGSEESESYQTFITSASEALAQQAAGVMLTPAMCASYNAAVAERKALSGVSLLSTGKTGNEQECSASLFATDLATFAKTPLLQEEVFGFSALVVRCADIAEMMQFVSLLKGNLTASIHGLDSDLATSKELSLSLAHKVGRLIYNQMPTGVEVCASMNHGGPFPASTNIRTTSVGSEAITRFRRPICYQNMPTELLPALLKD
ncbi:MULTISPECIES: aldehyde dehydrogenase (NADP(+)) [Colwellia]|uniref:Fatty aldehyde dehydrogenase n=1 Tax=Colwellia marinimaniae TaxID=1513592 RepID=A0ABQ0MUX5_9GAMM|nr:MULTISPECIES: aldehyde dehydrogenase (NADP(+)) [Colwellia]GAW96162.1 fatty aldehyde dehydrogenase [Colwellia marinimaniae]